jgi:hypothetical protein
MIMERTEVLDLMSHLRLFGMKNAYDEILATAIKRQHEPQRFAGVCSRRRFRRLERRRGDQGRARSNTN